MTQCTTQNTRRAAGLEDLFTFLDASGNSIQVQHSIPSANSSKHVIPTRICTHQTLDETPDETLGTTKHEAEAFAKAIDKIVKANYGSSKSKPKLWEPINSTGLTCRNFAPSSFSTNWTSEIIRSIPGQYYKGQLHFVHLKGSALDCFEPALLDPIEPIWLWDLNLFIRNSKPISEPTIQSAKQKQKSKDFTCMKVIRLKVFY